MMSGTTTVYFTMLAQRKKECGGAEPAQQAIPYARQNIQAKHCGGLTR